MLSGAGLTSSEALALAVLLAGALAALGLLWLSARPGLGAPAASPAAAPAATTEDPGVIVAPGEVVVHVAGAVVKPGLYRLAGGARIADALEAAGGPQPAAALDALNLARPLTDGEQLLVPVAPAPGTAPAAPASPGAPAPRPASGQQASGKRPDGRLDLNRASVAELDELPGIGPVLAERIVAHRGQTGGFTSVGALRDVPGIGEKTFQKLAPMVAV